jgi:hypothetical protein
MISFAEVVGGAERRAIAMLSPLAVAPEKQRQGLSADAAVPRGAVVYPPAFDTVTEC